MMKRMTAIVLCLMLVFSISGCSRRVEKAKEFEVEGLTITLTDAFKVKENPLYTSFFSQHIKIVVQPISVESMGDFPLDEYARQTCDALSVDQGPQVLTMPTPENNYVAEYSLEGTDETEDTINMLAFYKSDDYYWNITFACPSGEYASLKPQFLAWAETVKLP